MPNPMMANGTQYDLPVPDWLEPFIPPEFQQGTICPPGTACTGPSFELPGGIQACVGSCAPTGPTDPSGITPTPMGCPEGTFPVTREDGTVICTDMFGGGDIQPQPQPQPQNGVQPCGCKVNTCCTPGGKKGHKNKARYFRLKGKCLDPTVASNYELVQKEGRCIASRRSTNPANGKAAVRAMRRVNTSLKYAKNLEKAVRRAAGRSTPRRK